MHESIAQQILDNTSYATLATADAAGRPWASPVWFAQEDYRELFWVSDPRARHSLNVAARPELALVVFDSTVAPYEGQAVYMSATATQVTDPAELERGIGVFSRVAVRKGIGAWGTERVSGDARLRLYRAAVSEHSILDKDAIGDVRIPVSP
jgi:hypothetical protein